jgi:hypothetical protein
MKTRPNLVASKEPDVKELKESLEEWMRQVFQDISRGSSTHIIKASAPAVGDIENGEIRLQDGVNKRLYTKMDGTLYYITLTGV